MARRPTLSDLDGNTARQKVERVRLDDRSLRGRDRVTTLDDDVFDLNCYHREMEQAERFRRTPPNNRDVRALEAAWDKYWNLLRAKGLPLLAPSRPLQVRLPFRRGTYGQFPRGGFVVEPEGDRRVIALLETYRALGARRLRSKDDLRAVHIGLRYEYGDMFAPDHRAETHASLARRFKMSVARVRSHLKRYAALKTPAPTT